MDVDSFSPDATGSQRRGWRRVRRGRHRLDVLPDDARAVSQRSLVARIAPEILFTVSCVAVTYAAVLHMTHAGGSAVVITLVMTGAPLAFLAIRLVIYLAAHRHGRPVDFWPPDRSPVVNFGLALLVANMVVAGILTAALLDEWLFAGRIWAFLEQLQT